MSRKKPDDIIRVKLDTADIEITTAESEATYDEIKDYILKTYNLKVSSLYIAQVKEKMGIKERVNYNLSKKEDAKVPICPEEKENAIISAFKHFKMI